jgi:hypothetical protein
MCYSFNNERKQKMAKCTCKKWGCEADCICNCHRENPEIVRKFKKGDVVKVKASGYKAKVYDYEDRLFNEIMVLVRFFGRHSLDLFNEDELELIKRKVS